MARSNITGAKSKRMIQLGWEMLQNVFSADELKLGYRTVGLLLAANVCYDAKIHSIFSASLILLGPEGLTFLWVSKN